MGKDNDKCYYVYAAKYRGIIVYIGNGKENRLHHCKTGSSHNSLLNELCFRYKVLGDEEVITDTLESGLTKEKAEEREAIYIRRYHPIGNSQLKTNAKRFPVAFEVELRSVASELGLLYILDKVSFLADPYLLLTRLGVTIETNRYNEHIDYSSSVCDISSIDGKDRLTIKDVVFDGLLLLEPAFARFRDTNVSIRNTMPKCYQSEGIKPYYYEKCLDYANIEEIFYSLGLRPITNKHTNNGRDGIPATRYLVHEDDGAYSLYEATIKSVVMVERFDDYHFAFNSMLRTKQKVTKKAVEVWNDVSGCKPKKPFFV